jgi:CRP/FNR family transcriptional regulator
MGSIVIVKKNQFLYKEGFRATKLFVVKSGKFLKKKCTLDGKELYLSIFSEGAIIGGYSLFEENAKYDTDAIALELSEVYAVDYQTIENHVLLGGSFTAELLKFACYYNKRNELKFRDYVLYGNKGALYSTLISLAYSNGIAKENGILIDIKLTNVDLANFCRMARESVSRIISELKSLGVIHSENGKLLISDLKFLKKEINFQECSKEICSIVAPEIKNNRTFTEGEFIE